MSEKLFVTTDFACGRTATVASETTQRIEVRNGFDCECRAAIESTLVIGDTDDDVDPTIARYAKKTPYTHKEILSKPPKEWLKLRLQRGDTGDHVWEDATICVEFGSPPEDQRPYHLSARVLVSATETEGGVAKGTRWSKPLQRRAEVHLS